MGHYLDGNRYGMMQSSPLTVMTLINGAAPEWVNDRVFWYADHIMQFDDRIDIQVSNYHSLVAFDPLCKAYALPCVEEIARQLPCSAVQSVGPVLVSSGSLLFINGKLLITQRSADAVVDPLYWTTPAGRCDRTPLATALKETVEEIILLDGNGQMLVPEIAHDFAPKGGVQYYETSTPDIETRKIRFFVDGALVEEKHMWAYYNQDSNTLELRLPLSASIIGEVRHYNPEFHTPTMLADIAELQDYALVPALREFVREQISSI